MINFIVCDDVIKYRQMIEKIIDKYMMKNKLEYKTYIYNDYDEDFMKMVSSKLPFKVYILDIETPTKSGIDIARIIRHKDINSILIFITGHQELDRIVMKNDFLFLAFINKFDNCEERLMNALDKSLKLFQIKKVIKFKDNGIMYSIPLDDILYITRDSIDRKCIIVTDYSEFRVSKNLNEIEGMVNANFIKTHRACLINKKRITSYNKPKRIVTFDNGTKTDLISTRFDKELI
ncbi:MAG: response regulator transcription factor [Bacilli bacterium]|nr:response regulator transcription factor [Bacilli bacterium]